MTASTNRVCPICQRDDRIQRVKSIINSGTTTSAIYSNDSILAKGHAENTTELARRLQKPFSRVERPMNTSGCAIIPGVLVLGVGGMLLMIAMVYGAISALLMIASPVPAEASEGTQGVLISVVVLIIGGLILYGGIRLIQGISRRNTANEQRYQAARSQYQQELAQEKQAQSRWEHELYYCFRDDCVFIPGQNQSASPEQMNQVLYH